MRRCRRPALLFLLGITLAGPNAHADTAPESLQAFAGDVATAQAVAEACGRDKSACKDAHLPQEARVQGTHGTFTMRWRFAGDALQRAAEAPDADRRQSMQALQQQLTTLLAEASAASSSAHETDLARSHREAARILARPEFQGAGGPGWLERQLARVQEAMLRIFTGMDRLGKRAPWIAPLVEWTCFALAAAGLLWYIRQSLRRQSLLLSLEAQTPATTVRGRDAAAWQQLAADHAAKGEYREAVHGLFWAAIATLEAHRAWRPNPTRTPREYARLLRPGSDAQAALRELTQLMETSWYGARPASEADVRRAQERVNALALDRTASPRSAALAAPTGGAA